jgi:DNA ligase-1
MSNFNPLLAAKVEDVKKLQFPLYASPKLDGIRCIIRGGKALTRSLKLVPNNHVQAVVRMAYFEDHLKRLEGLDGELLLEDWRRPFHEVSSAIMSVGGSPSFAFHVFDVQGLPLGFKERLGHIREVTAKLGLPWLRVVPHKVLKDLSALEQYEAMAVADGYEGVMLRSVDGPYKHGRSTAKEGILMKLKRFEDAEAVIIGFEEAKQNTNAQETDETGHAKRSSKKEGLRPKGTLGALVCVTKARFFEAQVDHRFSDFSEEDKFRIGTGPALTAKTRKHIWDNRSEYEEKTIKYRFQLHGTKDRPRIPSVYEFVGVRAPADQ